MNAHALEFSQAFNYTDLARYGRGVFLEVTLVANSHMTPTLRVRVDSAASFCVFGRQWANMLALDWEAGDPVTIGTATGLFLPTVMTSPFISLITNGQLESRLLSGIRRSLPGS